MYIRYVLLLQALTAAILYRDELDFAVFLLKTIVMNIYHLGELTCTFRSLATLCNAACAMQVRRKRFLTFSRNLVTHSCTLLSRHRSSTLTMPRLLLWQKSSDPICHSRGQDDVPLRQADVADLLSQLETHELRNPYFQLARKRLRQGQPMRAIQDCCYPFNLGGRVSRTGHYIQFDVCIAHQSRSPLSTDPCH